MAIPEAMLRKLVNTANASGDLAHQDAQSALEIACLAVVADGKLADEELAALHIFRSELNAFTKSELDALVKKSINLATRDDRLERLKIVAATLTSDHARHLAYQLSVATALADLAAADEEFEFDLDLQDALDLDPHVADQLTSAVNEALLLGE
jgi:hypothetical protein